MFVPDNRPITPAERRVISLLHGGINRVLPLADAEFVRSLLPQHIEAGGEIAGIAVELDGGDAGTPAFVVLFSGGSWQVVFPEELEGIAVGWGTREPLSEGTDLCFGTRSAPALPLGYWSRRLRPRVCQV